MMVYRRFSVIFTLSLLSLVPRAVGDLIAYESFDYADLGGDLVRKDGGVGFHRNWRTGFGTSTADALDIAEGSLSFLGLQTHGNRVVNSTPLTVPTTLVRQFENQTDETTTKYLSFLVRPEGSVGEGRFMGFGGVPLWSSEDWQREAQLTVTKSGIQNHDSFIMENFACTGGCRQHSSGVPVLSGETTFVVVKAELKPGFDTVTLFINPIPGLPEPASGTVKDDLDLGSVRGVALDASGTFSFDEIRWGDAFADVTPGTPPSIVELIRTGETWNYFAGTTEPSPFPELAWTRPQFDDATWNTGQEGFGYGPDAEARNVVTALEDMKDNYGTAYLRRGFAVEDPSALSNIILQLDADDAFIAYINGLEVARSSSSGVLQQGEPVPSDMSIRRHRRRGSGPQNFLIDVSSFPDLLREGEDNVLAIQGINGRSSDMDFVLSNIQLLGLGPIVDPPLLAGDANMDLQFDQLDLVQVQIAAKYLTGQEATWGEGDWDGAPGGTPGDPPMGDGLFNQFDIIAAQQADLYLTGPYGAIQQNGQRRDGQASIVYNPSTGELSVNTPSRVELTSINIDSAAGIFTGESAQNLGGSFDNDADANIFKATFGGSFGSVSFGNVAQTGLSEEFVLGDLTVVGSLAGGGDLGSVDLVYVPEPTSAVLLAIGLMIGIIRFWTRPVLRVSRSPLAG